MTERVTFLHKGVATSTTLTRPEETLLDWLRLRAHVTGVKEGCGEGDCGACTVVLGRARDGGVEFRPANSCIYLLGMMEGQELVTVEDLAADGALHPVQNAMVAEHASQCGFCTPGFVMSLFALYHEGGDISRPRIEDALSGNLCRCTGYRPIVDAALAACASPPQDAFVAGTARAAALHALAASRGSLIFGTRERFFASPQTLAEALRLRAEHADAIVVAGATDVGLWITKRLKDIPKIIWLGRVAELNRITETEGAIEIGGGVCLEDARAALTALHPDIGEVVRRFGSRQVRASGTIGGNIANGSPIGDTPPVLIALGASIELASAAGRRRLALEDFFIGYGAQNIAKDELLTRISVPRLGPDSRFFCAKISRRYDQDISSVLGAFALKVDGDRIVSARAAFGGMAETPKRARETEGALAGLRFGDEAGARKAADKLDRDFTPISDLRASAAYRSAAAKALLLKALAEFSGAPRSETRLFITGDAHA